MENKLKKLSNGNIIYVTFSVGLLIKALDATAEIGAGIGLIFLTPEIINNFTEFVSKGILSPYLGDRVIEFGRSFSIKTRHFAIFYLLSHGILKMTVIFFLWKEKLWAYPLSVAIFGFFIVYQTYHFIGSHSIFLLLLTVLDAAMIILTIAEYRRLKAANV